MALHRARWRDVIESQLAGNALGKIAPAGGAIGAALQYRMLVESGLERGRTVAGITAVNLLTFAVVLALPILVLPTFLRGSVDRTLVEATLIGVAVFTLLSAAAVALLAFDRPLELVGRAVQCGPQQACVAARSRIRGMPERLRTRARQADRDPRPALEAGGGRDRRSLGLRLRDACSRRWPRSARRRGPSLVLLAFCAAQVLAQIPVTPGGLGFVEAGLTAMLALAGVGAGRAVLATLRLPAVLLLAAAAGRAWRASSSTSAASRSARPTLRRSTRRERSDHLRRPRDRPARARRQRGCSPTRCCARGCSG